ncbi:potassium channel [Aureococcus anophagefferens]|nr:potassium channel [Aureococcus anophagefferens]
MAEPARVLRAAEDGRTFGDTVITLVAPVLLSLSLFVTAESVRRMLRRLAAAKAHVETRSAVKKELKYAVDAEAGGALSAEAEAALRAALRLPYLFTAADAYLVYADAFADGAFVVFYVISGCAIFGWYERWHWTETWYYLAVTCTTVGYGDYSPASQSGKLWACLYVPLGIVQIFSIITSRVTAFEDGFEGLEAWVLRAFFGVEAVDTLRLPAEEYSPADVRARIWYPRRVLVKALPLLVALVVFFLLQRGAGGAGGRGRTVVDALYFTVVTATTVGYGDLTPTYHADKMATGVMCIVLVVVTANFIGAMHGLFLRRAARAGAYRPDVEAIALGNRGRTGRSLVSESEYVLGALARARLLDEEITAHLDADEEPLTRDAWVARYWEPKVRAALGDGAPPEAPGGAVVTQLTPAPTSRRPRPRCRRSARPTRAGLAAGLRDAEPAELRRGLAAVERVRSRPSSASGRRKSRAETEAPAAAPQVVPTYQEALDRKREREEAAIRFEAKPEPERKKSTHDRREPSDDAAAVSAGSRVARVGGRRREPAGEEKGEVSVEVVALPAAAPPPGSPAATLVELPSSPADAPAPEPPAGPRPKRRRAERRRWRHGLRGRARRGRVRQGRGGLGGFGSIAATMARAKKLAQDRLPIFVLYVVDGRVERACFRAKAERLKSKMGDKAKRAIVDKFFQRFPELGVTDAAPYVAESGTPLCVAEQEEKPYREGTVILEITKRDAA